MISFYSQCTKFLKPSPSTTDRGCISLAIYEIRIFSNSLAGIIAYCFFVRTESIDICLLFFCSGKSSDSQWDFLFLLQDPSSVIWFLCWVYSFMTPGWQRCKKMRNESNEYVYINTALALISLNWLNNWFVSRKNWSNLYLFYSIKHWKNI